MTGAPALRLAGVSRRFGSLLAVDSVDLEVDAGTCHGLIGPNGAGKSTLLGLVAGTIAVSQGHIELYGRPVTGLAAHRRAGLGLVKTFQHTTLFDGLTVGENILLAVQRRLGLAHRLRLTRRTRALVESEVDELAGRVGLRGRLTTPAGALSHGERRQLEIATVLGTRPKVLLLDEPTAGMSIAETVALTELVDSMLPELTVIITEHDLDVLFRLAHNVTVLSAGRVLFAGAAKEVEDSEEVQRAYLGSARAGRRS